jgi:predicted secreted Zn-dependent protease
LKHEAKETGNIKRESKNYSYKEQMAARELEKELAAKQNKTDTPQLTKKQQEMLQQQLDQEQTIRDNVKKVLFILKFLPGLNCFSSLD